MKHVLPQMPKTPEEFPMSFKNIEKLFATYEVTEELKAKLLLPLLTPRAKAILSGLEVDQLQEYVDIKEFVLRQFRLIPRELKDIFNTANRNNDEIFPLFNARLQSLFKYCFRSRGAEYNFEHSFDLMISDRLKDCLPAGSITPVLFREDDECYSSDKVAELADIHINNIQYGKYKGNALTNFDKGQKSKFHSRSCGSWQNKTAEQADQIKKAELLRAI